MKLLLKETIVERVQFVQQPFSLLPLSHFSLNFLIEVQSLKVEPGLRDGRQEVVTIQNHVARNWQPSIMEYTLYQTISLSLSLVLYLSLSLSRVLS